MYGSRELPGVNDRAVSCSHLPPYPSITNETLKAQSRGFYLQIMYDGPT
jgi:hypothetical protein